MNIPAGFYRYNDVGKELYHYTNSNGFLSFVESKKLRLSHINFQNDAQEFYYAWNLIKEIANEYYDDLNTDIFRIDTDKIYRIFTFSLTTKRDDLSQWRGYAPSHGYCFSLNSGQLYSIVNRYNLRLERCIYNKEEQRKLIIEKFSMALETRLILIKLALLTRLLIQTVVCIVKW